MRTGPESGPESGAEYRLGSHSVRAAFPPPHYHAGAPCPQPCLLRLRVALACVATLCVQDAGARAESPRYRRSTGNGPYRAVPHVRDEPTAERYYLFKHVPVQAGISVL